MALGNFEQILGYFVPVVVFFLGLSAAAMLRLPRPPDDAGVFRAPLHPVPVTLFLLLVAAMVVMFAYGRTLQTLIGAGVAMLGIPASWVVIRRARPSFTGTGVILDSER